MLYLKNALGKHLFLCTEKQILLHELFFNAIIKNENEKLRKRCANSSIVKLINGIFDSKLLLVMMN